MHVNIFSYSDKTTLNMLLQLPRHQFMYAHLIGLGRTILLNFIVVLFLCVFFFFFSISSLYLISLNVNLKTFRSEKKYLENMRFCPVRIRLQNILETTGTQTLVQVLGQLSVTGICMPATCLLWAAF